MLTVGSLFSGIGGLDLGLERAGMRVVWQSEIDEYASKVLAKHWPDVPNLGDIHGIDWEMVRRADVVTGGFPCQPYSVAGKQGGEDDERNLWPEVMRCLRGVRPRWFLGENVPNLVNFEYFDRICLDLEEAGYEVWPWEFPAEAVGAPHIRYRLFVVGYLADSDFHGCNEQTPQLGGALCYFHGEHQEEEGGRPHKQRWLIGDGSCWATDPADVADAEELAVRAGLRQGGSAPEWWRRHGDGRRQVRDDEDRCPACGSHGTTPPLLGRVAHGIPDRVDRLRCLGNAVVPQVAELFGRFIVEYDGA